MSHKVKVKVKPYRLWLAVMVPAVIIGGFFEPLLGLVVPVVMLAALATAFSGGGRRFCGNYCPRGSFLDGWVARLPSFGLKMPDVKVARWVVAALLMGFMVWRISLNPTDIKHLGNVFWTMCLLTTAMALVLAALYRQRAWCMICPVGSFSTLAKTTKFEIPVPEGCKKCNLCSKACPIGLHPAKGIHGSSECLQCGACTSVCPVLKKKAA